RGRDERCRAPGQPLAPPRLLPALVTESASPLDLAGFGFLGPAGAALSFPFPGLDSAPAAAGGLSRGWARGLSPGPSRITTPLLATTKGSWKLTSTSRSTKG